MIAIDDPVGLEGEAIRALSDICGKEFVLTGIDELSEYGKDQTLDLFFPCHLLIKPGTAEEIAAVLKVCNKYKIPVTPRGGGSGVTGGALPLNGGVVLSLERLNRILSIDTIDRYIIAESGVVAADLYNYIEGYGLYFPVMPSSSFYSFLGGNVAENAGSIYSCRYGSTDKYVLNLEVVLPTGEIIWSGANVSKNVSGLNLTQLFTGSEGLLGIITKVVYRLIKKPALEVSMLLSFDRFADACKAVIDIRQSDLTPSAVELIGNTAIRVTANYLKEAFPTIKDSTRALLLIILQDKTQQGLFKDMDEVVMIAEKFTQEEVLVAESSLEKEKLWKIRYAIGPALTEGGGKYRDIDICVPLSFLNRYIETVEAICESHHIPVACFGHALDGNLHVMLMLNDANPAGGSENLDKAIRSIYSYAISNGGVITGEHGIGLLQKDFMSIQFSASHLELMREIKKVFDPNGILNPGKFL